MAKVKVYKQGDDEKRFTMLSVIEDKETGFREEIGEMPYRGGTIVRSITRTREPDFTYTTNTSFLWVPPMEKAVVQEEKVRFAQKK
jgi:hypothetical protein